MRVYIKKETIYYYNLSVFFGFVWLSVLCDQIGAVFYWRFHKILTFSALFCHFFNILIIYMLMLCKFSFKM
jgi:hypothetical protein